MSPSVSRGRFVWYDLMTPDPDAAADFYHEVAGWSSTPWEEGESSGGPPYMMWTVGDRMIGGRAPLPEEARAGGAPPHWLAYVTVPDTAAVVERTLKAGGKVVVPATSLPGVGTFVVLQDPQGAVFAPYTPEDGPGGEVAAPSMGEFSWHELATTDHKSAMAFYSEIFGWKRNEAMDMGPLGIYQLFGPEVDVGFPFGGMFDKPDEMPAPPHWLHYIRIPDIHAAVERVKELGGQILHGPETVPGGDLIAQCLDPQGAAFALHQMSRG